MEKHPIPQHVSGYEFRLVGDMTLKQFLELAVGAGLALLFWSLPLPIFFKYPLTGFFALLGVMLAFVPVNEQPLDRWIINFLKAVYSPTQYVYQKGGTSLDFLEEAPLPVPSRQPVTIKPTPRKKTDEPLKAVPSSQLPALDQDLNQNLQKLNRLFEEITIQPKPKREKLIEEVVKIPVVKRKPRKTVQPKFEPSLPMPSRPTVPNILVGMVLDKNGKILPDVIIEIRDQDGFPVRALKTNKLGQFQIATPLKNGVYEIELEKEGYHFDIIKFKAQGKIIEPLEIKAK